MYHITLFVILIIIQNVTLQTLQYEPNTEHNFQNFLQKYKKEYQTEEENARRNQNFQDKLRLIKEWNTKSDYAVYEINNFTDLTYEEIERDYMGFKHNMSIKNLHIDYIGLGTPPVTLDWRDKNVVTPVKNQGRCANSYVFSAIAEIEGQHALRTGQLVSLSEQHGLDCDTSEGCSGGHVQDVFDALEKQGGVETFNDYPYEGHKRKCRTDPSKITAKVLRGKTGALFNEKTIRTLLASHGPLSIALYMSPSLVAYKSGITRGMDCGHHKPNHAVLIVGYGIENGLQYWLIKNSYGPTWGENGYFRIIRGKNACNIGAYIALSSDD